jgi:hypothetical protein
MKHAADNATKNSRMIFLELKDSKIIDRNAVLLFNKTPIINDNIDNKITMRAVLDDDDCSPDKGRQLNA